MARTIRKSTDNLEQMLQDLKIGEPPILDTESGYDICRVPSGLHLPETNIWFGICSRKRKSRL